jgi:hypothetical protein
MMKAKADTEIFSDRHRIVDGLSARNERIIRHFFEKCTLIFRYFVGIKYNFVKRKRNFEENKYNLVESKCNFEENKYNFAQSKYNFEESKYNLNINI